MKPQARIMPIRNHGFLLSERSTLQKLLERASPDDALGQISLAHRLQEVERELEAYAEGSSHRAEAYLTFWGSPVKGHRGVHANFGSEAVKLFVKAVTAVGANQRATLSARGQIPNHQDYRLLITGTAPGSFSVYVEDASQQPVRTGETTPAENAIEQVKDILAASVGDQQQFTVATADIDRQALTTIHAFIKILADSEALCALAFRNDEFRFQDTKQVKRSETRLQPNGQETHATLTVRLRGFLPGSRKAEFEILSVHTPISSAEVGRIAESQVAPIVADAIDIQALMAQPVSIDVRTQRTGPGQLRYALITRISQDTSFSSIAAT